LCGGGLGFLGENFFDHVVLEIDGEDKGSLVAGPIVAVSRIAGIGGHSPLLRNAYHAGFNDNG
jgi:hypothetical protein